MENCTLNERVKVCRFLTSDPYNKRGEWGTVNAIDDDIATVEFSDGVIGYYEFNALEK